MNKQELRGILKKRTTKFAIFSIILIAIIFGIYSYGFIPVGLSAKSPVGNIEIIGVQQYIESCSDLSDMPNYDKIVLKIFGTDETKEVVLADYKEKLQDEGYSLKYSGSGSLCGKNFDYVGYLKGLTAVGIIISSEGQDEVGCETVVIYMTGSAFDFLPLLDWYQEKFNSNEFN